MSRIYFHSEHGEARVSGTERHYMGRMLGNLFNLMLGLEDEQDYHGHQSVYRKLLIPGHYLENEGERFVQYLKVALRVEMDDVLQIDGKNVSTSRAKHNTALRVGNDAIKLMARLHGQCEIHCWVDGGNRAWLASIIERGVEIGLLRDSEAWPTGWGTVASLLRSRSDGPVVTSYGMCESFPNRSIAGWDAPIDEDGEEDRDAWYDLPDQEKWALGMAGLKKDHWLELKPDNWETYYFRDGVDAFAIKKAAEAAAKSGKTPSGGAP